MEKSSQKLLKTVIYNQTWVSVHKFVVHKLVYSSEEGLMKFRVNFL